MFRASLLQRCAGGGISFRIFIPIGGGGGRGSSMLGGRYPNSRSALSCPTMATLPTHRFIPPPAGFDDTCTVTTAGQNLSEHCAVNPSHDDAAAPNAAPPCPAQEAQRAETEHDLFDAVRFATVSAPSPRLLLNMAAIKATGPYSGITFPPSSPAASTREDDEEEEEDEEGTESGSSLPSAASLRPQAAALVYPAFMEGSPRMMMSMAASPRTNKGIA